MLEGKIGNYSSARLLERIMSENKGIHQLRGQVEFLTVQLKEALEEKEANLKLLRQMEENLKNSDPIMYNIIVRNEIEKLDLLLWHTKPKFRCIESDLKHYTDYKRLEKEKHRLGLIHLLENNTGYKIRSILRSLTAKGLSVYDFAEGIAEAYSQISEDMLKYSYTGTMDQQQCSSVTSDLAINPCVNVLMDLVEMSSMMSASWIKGKR